MIAERFPGIDSLDKKDKLLLAEELVRDARDDDEGVPLLTEKSIRIIEARLDHYLKNPETGNSWEEVKAMRRARDSG